MLQALSAIKDAFSNRIANSAQLRFIKKLLKGGYIICYSRKT
jgi:hypothetical protein